MRARRRVGGFTYVGLIILVAIIGLVAALTVKLGSTLQRRAAEQELLEVGAAYGDALKSYAEASPPGVRQSPATLEELLRDPRFPAVRRHLRKLFADPVTGEEKWGLVRGPDKIGIIGVYSLSDAQPIKQSNFDARFAQFDHREHLSDWKFVAVGAVLPPSAPEGPPPQQQPKVQPGPPPIPAPAADTEAPPRVELSPPGEAPSAEQAADPAPAVDSDKTDASTVPVPKKK